LVEQLNPVSRELGSEENVVKKQGIAAPYGEALPNLPLAFTKEKQWLLTLILYDLENRVNAITTNPIQLKGVNE
jgi:hypothetical protein